MNNVLNHFQNCLKVLNISGNKISNLRDIKNLLKLEVLDARKNAIDDINDLTESISTLTSLKDLSLQDNPVTQSYRYRENLIANNDTISMSTIRLCICIYISFQNVLTNRNAR